MSRSFTPAELLAMLRERCDLESDTHIDDTEMYKFLSAASTETWDLLVRSGLAEQYVKNNTFTVVAGQQEYDTTSAAVVTAQDFYKVHALYVSEGNGRYRSIPRINPVEMETFRAPTQAATMKLYYIPHAPKMVAGGSSFEGFNGWEEHLLACAEILVRKKREESFQGAYELKRDMERRIQSMANTDWSEPARVVRRRSRRRVYDVGNAAIAAWGIRGGKIELYECDLYGIIRS